MRWRSCCPAIEKDILLRLNGMDLMSGLWIGTHEYRTPFKSILTTLKKIISMTLLKESWVDTYPIHSYEVDSQSRLSIVSAINYFQESAWRNADAMGFGFHDLAANNRFWVLSRLYVEMYRYPLWGDTLQVETWPKGMESLFALRDFRFKSADGKELFGAGTSAWLIIDGATHRLQRVDHVCSDMPCYPQDALNRQPGKIALAATMTPQARIVAGYTDVDVNNHVNNACYLNWAVNYLPVDSKTLTVRSAEINFLSESLLHSPVEILYGSDSEHTWICSLRNPGTGKEYCRIRLTVGNS
jgi:acyl-ACP thioesterase